MARQPNIVKRLADSIPIKESLPKGKVFEYLNTSK